MAFSFFRRVKHDPSFVLTSVKPGGYGKNRRFLIVVSILMAFLAEGNLYAQDSGGGSTAFGSDGPIVLHSTYNLPKNSAVGSILQQKEEVVVRSLLYTSNVTCRVNKSVVVHGTPVPGMSSTYATNVPGIGVRMYTTKYWNDGWELAPAETWFIPPRNGSTQYGLTAELVVTGPVGSGTLTSLPWMSIQMWSDCSTSLYYEQYIAPGTVIQGTTCLVTTRDLTVTLPQVNTRDFPSVGTTRGNMAINIGLNCTPGTDVYITLTDATASGNVSDQLTLTQDSTAEGVKLRILHNSVPVAFGPDSGAAGTLNQLRVGASDSLSMIPLTVQYISTGKVTPGVVRGLATFTMSYQ